MTTGGRPDTHYLETPTGYLAYQVFGSGEPDILFNTSALKNLDAIWDEPSAVRFFDRLAGMGRVIHYDMRGCGVSDPISNRDMWLPIDANVDDIRAVLDAVGSERAVVYGDVEGGFSAMVFAATNPGRVSSLVLVNCLPRLMRSDDYLIGMPPEMAHTLSDLYVTQHGTTGAMLELTAPSVADDPRFRAWWVRYSRLAIPKGLARTTFDWFQEVDVRSALPLIQAPTLVVARRDGLYHRLAYAEYISEHIPNAELKVVDGADTIPYHAGDFGPTLDHVSAFIAGRDEVATTNRVLATVMFTDIVQSTQRAAALGDERWLDLLAEHDRIVRSQLERFQGREVAMTGDGSVATFDGPARAIACATSIREILSSIGLEARAGIHTGEIEIRNDEVKGLSLHIASRIMDKAEDGGIVVSSTVKDLAVGSNIAFDPVGEFELKGVPGVWQLFSVRTAA
jgi:class 3 adenylate cyclase/pimeloyl-ACP methyl ester carboxylesterase